MTLFLPDATVLINALRQDAEAHTACRSWLLDATRAGAQIGLCEPVETAIIRISTLPRVSFVSMEAVLGFWLEDLWSYPATRRLTATPAQNRLFARLLQDLGLIGNDVNDAWLAALAIDHGATLVSLDRGFSRFPGLHWLNPAA